jgi:hypothetical protein
MCNLIKPFDIPVFDSSLFGEVGFAMSETKGLLRKYVETFQGDHFPQALAFFVHDSFHFTSCVVDLSRTKSSDMIDVYCMDSLQRSNVTAISMARKAAKLLVGKVLDMSG